MNRNLFVKIFFTFGLENHLPVRRRKTTTMKEIHSELAKRNKEANELMKQILSNG